MITVDFQRLPLKPGSRVLDLGCGSGRHTCEAARRPDITVIGADPNPHELEQAGNRMNFHITVGEHGGGSWAFLRADAVSLPFTDSCFDLVICCEVLEHIPDHEQALVELARILKPGGNLVVSVPRWLPERICWALSEDYHQVEGGHLRIYRADELTALLAGAGLFKWSAHFAHGLHTPYWWLKCLLGPANDDSLLIKSYHELLLWDMMQHPRLTRTLDKCLSPFIGKSLVVYCRKGPAAACLTP